MHKCLLKHGGVMITLLFTGVSHADVRPASVEIFTNRDYPVEVLGLQQQGVTFVYYDVDLPKSLTTILRNALPSHADQTRQVKQQRLAQDENATLKHLARCWQGLARARTLGINKLPAIVFEGKTVVYGIQDAGIALAHFQQWQSSRP